MPERDNPVRRLVKILKDMANGKRMSKFDLDALAGLSD